MIRWYDRQGAPITDVRATELRLADPKYKIVRQESVPDGRRVSTVWLGLDHRFDDEGPPLIFETMVFKSEESYTDQFCRRTATENEALVAHDVTVYSCHGWLEVEL